MKLPTQTLAVQRTVGGAKLQAGLAPSISVWCMVKCLGFSALKCAYCLTSPACWVKCAGPKAYACYQKCK